MSSMHLNVYQYTDDEFQNEPNERFTQTYSRSNLKPKVNQRNCMKNIHFRRKFHFMNKTLALVENYVKTMNKEQTHFRKRDSVYKRRLIEDNKVLDAALEVDFEVRTSYRFLYNRYSGVQDHVLAQERDIIKCLELIRDLQRFDSYQDDNQRQQVVDIFNMLSEMLFSKREFYEEESIHVVRVVGDAKNLKNIKTMFELRRNYFFLVDRLIALEVFALSQDERLEKCMQIFGLNEEDIDDEDERAEIHQQEERDYFKSFKEISKRCISPEKYRSGSISPDHVVYFKSPSPYTKGRSHTPSPPPRSQHKPHPPSIVPRSQNQEEREGNLPHKDDEKCSFVNKDLMLFQPRPSSSCLPVRSNKPKSFRTIIPKSMIRDQECELQPQTLDQVNSTITTKQSLPVDQKGRDSAYCSSPIITSNPPSKPPLSQPQSRVPIRKSLLPLPNKLNVKKHQKITSLSGDENPSDFFLHTGENIVAHKEEAENHSVNELYEKRKGLMKGILRPQKIRKDVMTLVDQTVRPRVPKQANQYKICSQATNDAFEDQGESSTDIEKQIGFSKFNEQTARQQAQHISVPPTFKETNSHKSFINNGLYEDKKGLIKGILKPQKIRKDLLKLVDHTVRPRAPKNTTPVEICSKDWIVDSLEEKRESLTFIEKQQILPKMYTPKPPTYKYDPPKYKRTDSSHTSFVNGLFEDKKGSIKGLLKPQKFRKDLLGLVDETVRPRAPKQTTGDEIVNNDNSFNEYEESVMGVENQYHPSKTYDQSAQLNAPKQLQFINDSAIIKPVKDNHSSLMNSLFEDKKGLIKGLLKPEKSRKDLLKLVDHTVRPRATKQTTEVEIVNNENSFTNESEPKAHDQRARLHSSKQPQYINYSANMKPVKDSHTSFVNGLFEDKKTSIKGLLKPQKIRKDLLKLVDHTVRPRAPKQTTEVEIRSIVNDRNGIFNPFEDPKESLLCIENQQILPKMYTPEPPTYKYDPPKYKRTDSSHTSFVNGLFEEKKGSIKGLLKPQKFRKDLLGLVDQTVRPRAPKQESYGNNFSQAPGLKISDDTITVQTESMYRIQSSKIPRLPQISPSSTNKENTASRYLPRPPCNRSALPRLAKMTGGERPRLC